MKTYKAFRKLSGLILEEEEDLWQLIAYINTTSLELAHRRAKHVTAFCDWAGTPGVIFEVSDELQPDNWDKSTYDPPTLDGSLDLIIKLDNAKNKISRELKDRNDVMMGLRTEYENLNNT